MRYATILMMVILLMGLLSCEKQVEENGPVASFSVQPTTGPFTAVFTFDASGTSSEGESAESIEIRWDWDGDGIFDTDYSPNKLMNYQFEVAGEYQVTLEAINSLGWTDTEVFHVYVYADSVAPVATLEAIPDSCSSNTIIFFDATESWDPHSELEDLKFRWDWQGDGIWDTPFCSDSVRHYKYIEPGSYRVRVEVKNKIHLSDTTSHPVYIFEI
ncbi:MAG: hypothetical protein ABFS05_06125 [Bacteroidota bacterium]